ncbi:MAG: hypothetical protein ABSF81_13710 [Bacteroidales bacterium]|jgi:hypothetical protein
MIKIKLIYSLAYLIFISILAGCAPIRKIDRVAEGSPKGYVEFYYLKSEGNIGFSFPVYTVANPTKDSPPEGWVTASKLIFGDKVGLRLSKSPGKYTFYVGLSDFSQPISVSIKEGMVIPVRIVFTNIAKYAHTYGEIHNVENATTYKFNMKMYLGKPSPIAEYDKK